jgi:hypothetical protein
MLDRITNYAEEKISEMEGKVKKFYIETAIKKQWHNFQELCHIIMRPNLRIHRV